MEFVLLTGKSLLNERKPFGHGKDTVAVKWLRFTDLCLPAISAFLSEQDLRDFNEAHRMIGNENNPIGADPLPKTPLPLLALERLYISTKRIYRIS